MWKMPPKSPDLNPVERFWAWLRTKLRRMDLADAVDKRPVMSKDEYKARVRRVAHTKKAQEVASNQARLMKKVCRAVLKKEGGCHRLLTHAQTLRAIPRPDPALAVHSCQGRPS